MNLKKTAILIFFMFFSGAFALNCSICKRTIKNRYLKNARDQVFCSQKCMERTLPECANCKKRCLKGVYSLQNKKYCSKKCMAESNRCENCRKPTLKSVIIVNQNGQKLRICEACSTLPKCYYCSLPYRTEKLNDNRHICLNCRKTAVTSIDVIRSRVRFIRRRLKSLFNFDDLHHIELEIVPIDRLAKQAKEIYHGDNQRQLAMMRYYYEIVEETDFFGRKSKKLSREKCKIFILHSVPLALLDDALAHELAHDYLRHNAGIIKDLKLEEGFAETVAAEFNKSMNRQYLNKLKENRPDPIYGGGYRAISKLMREKGFAGTVKYLKSHAEPIL